MHASLDLEILGASLRGYVAGLGRALTADERRGLLLGVEWVSLELAARFAADALFEIVLRLGRAPASPAAASTTWSAPAASGRCTRRCSRRARSARRCSRTPTCIGLLAVPHFREFEATRQARGRRTGDG